MVSCGGANNPEETKVYTIARLVSVATDGRDAFIAWVEDAETEATGLLGETLRGAILTADGDVNASDLEVSFGSAYGNTAQVLFDGRSYVVISRGGFRVDTDGNVVQSGFWVPTLSGYSSPRGVSAKDAGLMVWTDTWDGYPAPLEVAWFPHDGAPFQIKLSEQVSLGAYGAASDGTDFLVAWHDQAGVRATRISAAGAIIDASPIVISTITDPNVVTAAFDGTDYVVAWGSGTLVAQRVTTSGVVLDPGGFRLGDVALGNDPRWSPPMWGTSCGASAIFVWGQANYVGARFVSDRPVTILPLPVITEEFSRIALAGSPSGCFVVWTRGGIQAARIGASGNLVDPTGIVVR